MSYESMAREFTECDFPGCSKDFDTHKGALCAIIKDGETKAFCAEHSRLLIGRGVVLRTLDVVHEELNKPKREREEAERKAREQDLVDGFVADLKQADSSEDLGALTRRYKKELTRRDGGVAARATYTKIKSLATPRS